MTIADENRALRQANEHWKQRIRELEAELELAKAWEKRKTLDWHGWVGEAQAQKARADKLEAELHMMTISNAKWKADAEKAEAELQSIVDDIPHIPTPEALPRYLELVASLVGPGFHSEFGDT